MGIKITTVTTATCDVCGEDCHPDDGQIHIQVNRGDGRDVGPATIDGVLRFYQPYGCTDGIVCVSCKRLWLSIYVDQLDKGRDTK